MFILLVFLTHVYHDAPFRECKTRYVLNGRLCGPQSRAEQLGEGKTLLSCRATNPIFSST